MPLQSGEEMRIGMRDFYDGKKVLLTGGTGFLGKVLIEKLLRSTKVDTIYVLIREKRGKSAESRLDDLLDDLVFRRVQEQDPKFKHRVVAIAGDCSLAGLGLQIKDVQRLVDCVNIVVHSAATVRFDERLDIAYSINVGGTRSIVNLCHQMKRLQAMVHVSTAYSNCHLKEIEEKFYDYPMNYEDVGLLLSKLDVQTLEQQTKRLLGPWPNTYTFTKALSESVIRLESKSLPVCVFRPSIVMPTYKEPVPGWSDNFAGPSGASTGVYTGFLRVIVCDKSKLVEIIPVDVCVNGILAAAWERGTRQRPTGGAIKIYNNVSSTENPIKWGEFITLGSMYARHYPPSFIRRDLDATCVMSKFHVTYMKVTRHLIPALLIDTVMFLMGQKPWMFHLYAKIHKYFDVTEFFSLNSWRFRNENVQALHASLSNEERHIFPMSVRDVHWMSYFRTYVLGARKYLLKDDETTIKRSRIRLARIKTCTAILKQLALFIFSAFLWTQLAKFF